MTPADRARQIDRDEFAAECAAIRQRAYDWLASQRPNEPKDVIRGLARLYEANGEKRTLREWSKISGLSISTLNSRINFYNWPVERAVTEKVGQFGQFGHRGKEYTLDGVTRSVSQWAKLAGISGPTAYARITSGWPIEAALTLPKGSARPTDAPGVSPDFAPSSGTGAGSATQAMAPENNFSRNDV